MRRTELFEISHRTYNLPGLHYGKFDNALDEREILDFCLCSPFQLLKENPGDSGNISNAAPITIEYSTELKKHLGEIVSIVGYLATYKSTRTKYLQEMAFGTYLDRDKNWIDTTHFPEVLAKYPIWRKGCYLITGKVVEEFGFYSIDVTEMKLLEFVDRDSD